MKLRELAHSRTGDKGNISNISLIAYDPANYELLEAGHCGPGQAFFDGVVLGDVVRYELPNIGALNFVMYQALGGGVTRTLALDIHGKSFSSALMEMEISATPKTNKLQPSQKILQLPNHRREQDFLSRRVRRVGIRALAENQ